ncbi:LamG-like jellyroll fold domain-containing protein [Tichowtungia aerotolerans]|uniref:Sialate O-acetylesterase domain-containing protein n=1 Tax=Tichowtungia aerotolerans TaxID=2697043 RepID=A0A6P1MCT9_9BACT|nr:LamG-like jellyroll fold domain-containing protein [Tichowtungia aerotolerans]QHI69416.1 hypothetical protein GT409_08100 [Tichowtungia aerotolerans]
MKRVCAGLMVFVAAALPSYAGLVAWWDFSDGTYRARAGALDGVAVGTVSVVDVTDSAVPFEKALRTAASGNNENYLNIGNIGSLGIYSNSFTLSYWVKASQATVDAGSGEVWESYSGSSASGYEGIQSVLRKSSQSNAGKLYTVVAENGTTSTKLLNHGILTNDQWHWIVIRYDGATDELKYFEDGVHVVYRDEIRIATLATQLERDARLGDGFGGLIADVRIYDTALSFSTDDFGAVISGELSEVPLKPEPPAPPPPAKLVGHWDFSDGAYDDLVGSNEGDPRGIYSIVPSGNEYFANAIEIGPTRNIDYFNVGTLENLNIGTNSFTVSYWVKHAAFTNVNGYVNTFESKQGGMGITTVLRASNISNPNRAYTTMESLDGTDGLLNGGTVADGAWHWIVIRYDGETDTADYFEDGHLYDTETGIFSLTDGLRKVFIGNGLDGQMGDIRIYNGALSYTLDGTGDVVGGQLATVTENWGVEYAVCPSDYQLYPRDRATDTAVVQISGAVSNGAVSSVLLRVFRDDVLSSTATQSLVFVDGAAPFAFDTTIAAETNNYDFEILLSKDGQENLVRRVEDVVAGDVFVIQGQSNADARLYDGSASENESPFIRTFGMNSDVAEVTETTRKWFLAKGDGSRGIPGGVGQWGLRMARLLVDEYQVPVAILNGAHGGRPIDFFQRNDAMAKDLNTNYGRLLYRAQAAGVADAIRSILWYQGESDQGDGDVHETGFVALYTDWKEDYPSVERFYIHQVRVGCGVDKNDVDLRDRQRCLPDTYPDMTVMSTTGVNGHEGCHYFYETGYKEIGNHIAALVAVDLYGSANTANVTAPNVDYVYFSKPTCDEITVVVRKPEDLLTFDAAASADFLLEGSPVAVTNGVIGANNTMVLSLDGDASGATGLSYTGHSYDGAWVTNAAGVGLLTFYNVPVRKGDSDNDGLADEWEAHFFGDAMGASPNEDSDSDGQSNLQEYIAGCDPTSSNSFFSARLSSDCVLGWNEVSGRVYSVYWTSNLLGGFQCLESNIPWTGSGFVDAAHHAEPLGFYRVEVQLQ